MKDNDPIELLSRVIKDWGIVELILFCIFIPYSIFYVIFRVIQERGKDE